MCLRSCVICLQMACKLLTDFLMLRSPACFGTSLHVAVVRWDGCLRPYRCPIEVRYFVSQVLRSSISWESQVRLPREAGCVPLRKRHSMQKGVRLSLDPCLGAVLCSIAAHVLCLCIFGCCLYMCFPYESCLAGCDNMCFLY